MAQHKSATDVTVAPLEEKTGFEAFVHRWWKLGAVAFAALAGLVLWLQNRGQQEVQVLNGGWDNLGALVQVESSQFGLPTVQLSSPAELEAFASSGGQSDAAAWAKALTVHAYFDAGEPEQALEASKAFEQQFSDHALAIRDETGGTQGTGLAVQMRERLEGLTTLRSRLPLLSGNRPPAADAPRVVLETSSGEIEVALYPDVAPEHVKNFLELSSNGTYIGTKFHRAIDAFMIQGGDQNSIDGEPGTWGQGDAGYTIPQEFGDLSHFRGVLAMAKRPDQVESGGHQFYITVSPSHHLDQVHTVFGSVTRGMDVVDGIVKGEKAPGTDRPAEAITIEGTRVL